MKTWKSTDFEVFDKEVNLLVSKSDSISEVVEERKIPYQENIYMGTSSSFMSDSGLTLLSKNQIMINIDNLPFTQKANLLKNQSISKNIVYSGYMYGSTTEKRKGFKTFSFSLNENMLVNVQYSDGEEILENKYLYKEYVDTELYVGNVKQYVYMYYYINNNTRYYVQSSEVTYTNLINFTNAICDDKIMYPLMIFIDGEFIPWSCCYFSAYYGTYKVIIDFTNFDINKYTIVSEEIGNSTFNPLFFTLPFDVEYGENVIYNTISDQDRILFTFDSNGKHYRLTGENNSSLLKSTSNVIYIKSLINLKTIQNTSKINIQNSPINYYNFSNYSDDENSMCFTKINNNKIDRVRKLFPSNVFLFTADDINKPLKLVDRDKVSVYNNIVYENGYQGKFSSVAKVFYENDTALSLSNLEFISQDWLEYYTSILTDFYNKSNINTYAKNKNAVTSNEYTDFKLAIIDGLLNIVYDKEQESKSSDITSSLNYTVKNGQLAVTFNDDNSFIRVDDSFIGQSAIDGSLYINYSNDLDDNLYDNLSCILKSNRFGDSYNITIDKQKFFNIFNKIYPYDFYNTNKGKLPLMDQISLEDQNMIFKHRGLVDSLYNAQIGSNKSLKYAFFNDSDFINMLKSKYMDPIGRYKFVYLPSNDNRDPYGIVDLTFSGTGIYDVNISTSKYIKNYMQDNLDNDIGIKTGSKRTVYYAKGGSDVYLDYKFINIAAEPVSGYISDGKILINILLDYDKIHECYYFNLNGINYYVKEYSDDGEYLLVEYIEDYSGYLISEYDPFLNYPSPNRLNNLQFSNNINVLELDSSSTISINFNLNKEKYIGKLTDTDQKVFTCTNIGTKVIIKNTENISINESIFYSKIGADTYGEFIFNNINSKWYLNNEEVDIREYGITLLGLVDIIKINVINNSTWSLNSKVIDISLYGFTFFGIPNLGDTIKINYSIETTGKLMQTYNEYDNEPTNVDNEYLQLSSVNGEIHQQLSSYISNIPEKDYVVYSGYVECIYDSSTNLWECTIYKKITEDIGYSQTEYSENLDLFAIDYKCIHNTPDNGDMIRVDFEPSEFKWAFYKAETNSDSILDGYYFNLDPTEDDVNLIDYGIHTLASIESTSLINPKIIDEDLLASKLGSDGTYTFIYDKFNNIWNIDNIQISNLLDFGIRINSSILLSNNDYITVRINSENIPSYLDTIFITIYNTDIKIMEMPDGSIYEESIAFDILKNYYGIYIDDYKNIIGMNDEISISYHNNTNIPKYILNLIMSPFDYSKNFDDIDKGIEKLEHYNLIQEKIEELKNRYKLYEYKLSSILMNNASAFNEYIKNNIANNISFSEFYGKDIYSKSIEIDSDRYIYLSTKNQTAATLGFYNLNLDPDSIDNYINNFYRYSDRFPYKISSTSNTDNNKYEFIHFMNINNMEKNIIINSADEKYKPYDIDIINKDTRLYSTNLNNKFIYPETSNAYVNVEFNIDKLKYKGIINGGSSISNSTFTPDATKGDFYLIRFDGSECYINNYNIDDITTDEYVIICVKDIFNASYTPNDTNLVPTFNNAEYWVIKSISELFDFDINELIEDTEYALISLVDDYYYGKNLILTNKNRFTCAKVYGGTREKAINDNELMQEFIRLPNQFRFCDIDSRYIIFLKRNGTIKYISSEQYRISTPTNRKMPYYENIVFFTFDILDSDIFFIFYIPNDMETIEFKNILPDRNGEITLDLNYEHKRAIHYSLDSSLYCIFCDGEKIPQSWIHPIGSDRISISTENNRAISYNNISIVRFINPELENRFDSYYDSKHLEILPDDESMKYKYYMKIGLDKYDIMCMIEKLNYQHKYASMGTEYDINGNYVSNYGNGMEEFIYWLSKDNNIENKLSVFDYTGIKNMINSDIFEGTNTKSINATYDLIRNFFIRNDNIIYGQQWLLYPEFDSKDNISTKKENLTTNTRDSNDPNNIYTYSIFGKISNYITISYNLINLVYDGPADIKENIEYFIFYLHTTDIVYKLPKSIKLYMGGRELIEDSDYVYNNITGKVTINHLDNALVINATSSKAIDTLEVVSMPVKTSYYSTEYFDSTGLMIKIYYLDGTSEILEEYEIEDINKIIGSRDEIKIIYGDEFINIPIDVIHVSEALLYTLSDNGEYYIIGNSIYNTIESIENITNISQVTSLPGNAIDGELWEGGNLLLPPIYNNKPVRGIAPRAFENINNIEEIILPDENLTVIGAAAFRNINNISNSTNDPININIDTNSIIDYIGIYCFYNDYINNIIRIPDGITEIKSYTFYNTNLPYEVDLNNVEVINTYAFYKSTISDSNIDFNKNLITIGDYAFYNCINLENLEFTNKVKTIGKYSFQKCNHLESISIMGDLERIGEYSFNNCQFLRSITLGSSLTRIDSCAFCYSSITRIDIPDNVTYMGVQVFYGSVGLQNISFSSNMNNIPSGTFQNCSNLTSIIIPSNIVTIGSNAFANCSKLANVELSEGVKTIYSNAFENCSSLTSMYFPDSVTKIDSNAFVNCSRLSSVSLKTAGGSSSSISQCPFNKCRNLTSITIRGNNTSCIYELFYTSLQYITSVTLEGHLESIGSNSFYGCTSLASITIPDSVIYIQNNAFEDCTSLTSITIPDSVTYIGEFAFSGCSSLTSITIPDSIERISSYAFNGCTSLTTITIPEIDNIGTGAFYNCSGLSSAEIYCSMSYSRLGSAIFRGCANLTTLTVHNCTTGLKTPDNRGYITYIESQLTNIILADDVEYIDDFSFNGCINLNSIIIPDSVYAIYCFAFANCTSLTTISIPSSVNYITYNVFDNCINLEDLYIYGIDIEYDVWDYEAAIVSNCDKDKLTIHVKELPSNEYWNYIDENTVATTVIDL